MFFGEEGDYYVSLEDVDSFDTIPKEMHEAPIKDEREELTISDEPIEDTNELISYADSIVTSGWFGYWRGWKLRPNINYFACGARLKIQPPQGAGDDTAMNGL